MYLLPVRRTWRVPALAATLLMVICFGLVLSGCQPETDTTVDARAVAADERAVAALLNEESRLAIAGDIDGLIALYVQDGKNARLSVTQSVSAMITGWDAVREHQENLLESSWMEWEDKQFSKENHWIKINGDNAWVVCDNVWRWREGEQRKQFQNIQMTICEKHDDRWLIAFQAFVRDPEHMEVIDLPS